jgi:large subunit ribosomal protein L13
MKTYSVKLDDIKRETHVVDAENKILGRIATEIATLLMGKGKALFSRNADVGDWVTVVNAAKLKVTGKKPQQKMYYRHSNYPGGFRVTPYDTMMTEHPERIITFAVDGMIPKNHLHDRVMRRLKVYTGAINATEVAEHAVVKQSIKKAQIRKVHIKVEVSGKKEAKR